MKNTALNEVLSTVAEVELTYKSKIKPSERPQVKKSSEVYKLLLDTWDEEDRITGAVQSFIA